MVVSFSSTSMSLFRFSLAPNEGPASIWFRISVVPFGIANFQELVLEIETGHTVSVIHNHKTIVILVYTNPHVLCIGVLWIRNNLPKHRDKTSVKISAKVVQDRGWNRKSKGGVIRHLSHKLPLILDKSPNPQAKINFKKFKILAMSTSRNSSILKR